MTEKDLNGAIAMVLSEYKELEKFCESGEAEFRFRASGLDKYALTPEKLAKVMKRTKEIWMESETSMAESDCARIAENIIEGLEK